ncbi:DUF4340 domain-containing protein [uncultured Brachyspira sp.]|uniref:DUF4340 domain-containing protein n=1 Tax=uncultured Brachyspira sp. TaxID=221953 RepID=UPI00262CE81D|nr:DUF4340 domain-containing protein [uncultured Brachyspira sp.]
MINKKYITLISIIIILTIILTITIFLKNKGYSLPNLKAINSNITEIKINRADKENISIKLTDNKWTVNDKYNADNSLIESMTNVLYNIQPVEIVSRGDAEALQKYKLSDDEILTVTVLDNSSKEIRNIKFGMKSTIGNTVYGQIANDKNIYLLGNTSSNPKDIFDKTESDFINKTISSIRHDNIQKITIEYNNNSYTLEKSKDDENSWIKTWNNNSISVNDAYSSVFAMANLKADGLIEDNNMAKNQSLYKISIQTSEGSTLSYSILNKMNDGKYEITSDNDSNRYYLSDSAFNNLEEAINKITA